MSSARLRMMAAMMKPYDAEVEYLETNSTDYPYIDTGIAGNTITRFEIDAICPNRATNTNTQLIGGTVNDRTTMFGSSVNNEWYCMVGTNRLGYALNRTYIDATISPSISGTLVDKVTNQTYSFTSMYPSSSWGFGAENLLLFGGHEERRSKNATCYGLKLYTSAGIVRDFIPVRVGTTGYMYDRVSGQLFGNAGSGSFVLGNDV